MERNFQMKLLHVGCGRKKYPFMTNLTQEDLDISIRWPYKSNSIDGIISMQVLQQIYWRDLMKALREMHRVLKPGGVMRFGTMLIENNDPEYMLGWENLIIFSFDLVKRILEKVGFTVIRIAKYQDSIIHEFKQVDDRSIGLGTSYIECIK